MESSSTPEHSEGPIRTESERDKYWELVDRSIRWDDRQEDRYQVRYDSHDWKMQYMVGNQMFGPFMHVIGHELNPPPKQPGFFARLRGQQPEPVQESPNEVSRHWTVSWGRTPDKQYVIYQEVPSERPEGIEGKTPAIAGGFWSATGKEPDEWLFPHAEGYKQVDPFEETNKMMTDLERSYPHENGVYWTKR